MRKTPEQLADEFIHAQNPVDPISSSEDRYALEKKMFLAGYYTALYENSCNAPAFPMTSASDQLCHYYAMYTGQLRLEHEKRMKSLSEGV